MESLIYNYFTRVNVFIPLLHRPSFERSLREGLQFKDRQFGSTVLMVCAIGSRYSPDPRVFLDGETELSCGWKYFSQISVLPKATFYKSSLYSVQHHVVSTFYQRSHSLQINALRFLAFSFLPDWNVCTTRGLEYLGHCFATHHGEGGAS